MKNINPLVSLEDVISCLSSYDPDSIRVDEAQDIINTMARGSLTSLAVEKVSLRSTLGRILARDIISPVNVPYQDNAAMDGYAFNGSIISDSDERRRRYHRYRVRFQAQAARQEWHTHNSFHCDLYPTP